MLERREHSERDNLSRRAGRARDVLARGQTAGTPGRANVRSAERRLNDLVRETDRIEAMLAAAAAERDPGARLHQLRVTQRRIDAVQGQLHEVSSTVLAVLARLSGRLF